MIVNFGIRKGEGPVQYAPFMLPLRDAGSGAVNTTLARGTGSATFTRAGATATTVLSTGLVSSTIAANTARSYYDPAPTGGTGLYMFLPGVSGAYASTPDSTAVSVTGDIDIRAQAALTSWASGTQVVVAKDATGGQRSYVLYVTAAGALGFTYYNDGTNARNTTSSANTGFSAGSQNWIRVTYATSTGKVNFYTSSDGVSWASLGVEQTITSGTIFDSTSIVEIGTNLTGTANFVSGRIYRAQIYNGIGGTLVADFNPQRTTQASTSFTGSTGETWTVNGRGFIYAEPLYLGYLSEEARTNLVLRSEDFSLAWAAVGTPTRSAAAKTCGAVNMDLIGDDSAAALEGYTQTITYTGDATKVVSFFIAQGTSTSVVIRLRDTTAPANRILAAITWAATGLPTITMTTGTSLGYQIFPNGIFRVSLLSSSVTAANTNSLEFYPATDAALSVANTGDAYIGGVESNNATFSTSYIPTAAATVTRAADVMTFPSAGNAVTAQGTIFCRAMAFDVSASRHTVGLSDASNNNACNMFIGSVNANRFQVQSGGAAQADVGVTATAANTTFRQAAIWGTNMANAYVNGTAGTLDATVTVPVSFSTINVGLRGDALFPLNGCIRDVRILQRVLSDSEIASLR